MAALEILKEEKLAERAEYLGTILRDELHKIKSPILKEVRGKGLFNAIEIEEHEGQTAWEVCLRMAEKGLLAKQTHGNIIRFAPPLVITEEQILDCARIIKEVILSF